MIHFKKNNEKFEKPVCIVIFPRWRYKLQNLSISTFHWNYKQSWPCNSWISFYVLYVYFHVRTRSVFYHYRSTLWHNGMLTLFFFKCHFKQSLATIMLCYYYGHIFVLKWIQQCFKIRVFFYDKQLNYKTRNILMNSCLYSIFDYLAVIVV